MLRRTGRATAATAAALSVVVSTLVAPQVVAAAEPEPVTVIVPPLCIAGTPRSAPSEEPTPAPTASEDALPSEQPTPEPTPEPDPTPETTPEPEPTPEPTPTVEPVWPPRVPAAELSDPPEVQWLWRDDTIASPAPASPRVTGEWQEIDLPFTAWVQSSPRAPGDALRVRVADAALDSGVTVRLFPSGESLGEWRVDEWGSIEETVTLPLGLADDTYVLQVSVVESVNAGEVASWRVEVPVVVEIPDPEPSPSQSPEPSTEDSVPDDSTLDDTTPTDSIADDTTAEWAGPCAAPVSGVTATAGINGATVTWQWSDEALGDGDVSFFVELTSDAPGVPPRVVEVAGDQRQAVVDGLRNGVDYSVWVHSATADGSTPPGDAASVRPTTGADGEVAGVIVTYAASVEAPPADGEVPGADAIDAVGLVPGVQVTDEAHIVEFTEAVDLSTAQEIADQLIREPEIAFAEPDLFMFTAEEGTEEPVAETVTVPDDPAYAIDQWNLWDAYGIGIGDGTAMTDAWAGPRGEGVTVAVIDTGITSHPDLDPQLVDGYDFVSSPEQLASSRQADAPPVPFDGDYVDEATYGGVGRDANPADPGDWRMVAPMRNSSWHGTKMAGIIAAAAGNAEGIAGIAPGAKVQPVRALSWRGGLLSDIATSITWASGGDVEGVPVNATPSKVINLSFAVQAICPVTLASAIEEARARGSIVVAAAGNAADDAANYAPGNCPGVITVGASTREGQRALYSNYGSTVDISAPGGDAAAQVATTSNRGLESPDESTVGGAQGTSVAAAHVSAGAAILASRDPGLTPDEAYEQLTGADYTREFANESCDESDPTRECGTGILAFAQPATLQAACSRTTEYVDRPGGTAGQKDAVVTFTGNQGTGCDFTWIPPAGIGAVQYLVVGGGGGGGAWVGGGGGGGAVVTGTAPAPDPRNQYSVRVGVGGVGAVYTAPNQGLTSPTAGGNSRIGAILAGGNPVEAVGGSSGASFSFAGVGPNGGIPNAGGGGSDGKAGGTGGYGSVYGGGGGAGADPLNGRTGVNAPLTCASAGGTGGFGVTGTIDPYVRTFGGGGGGATPDACTNGVGRDGGGNGGRPTGSNGTDNLGGGGGGGGGHSNAVTSQGGNGGSGLVLLRYAVDVPGAPGGLTAAPGSQQVVLTWSAPTSTGADPITDYVVQYRVSPAGTWTTFADDTSTTRSATVTGLVNGTAYDFQVAAVNGVGTGAYSSPVTSTPRTTPGAPTGVVGVPGNAQVSLSWTAPASDGGSVITGYTATASPGGATCTSPSTSCTVTGLVGGTAYTFTVTATNAAGTGVASTASAPVTPRGDPAALDVTRAASSPSGAGSAFAVQPQVSVKDANGNVVVDDSTTIVTATVSAGGTLIGDDTAVASAGVATFTNLGLSGVPGTYILTFSAGGSITDDTQAVDLEVGAAALLDDSTPAAGATYGSAFTTQPQISIDDSAGNRVTTSTATVTATIRNSSNVVLQTATATASGGVATFTGLGNNSAVTVGTHTITYTSPGLASVSQSITVGKAPLTVTASSPSVTYGRPAPLTITPSFSGFAYTDDSTALSTQPTCTSTYTDDSPVSSTPTTSCSGAVAANYTIAYTPGTVTVTRATATITAGSTTVAYGTATPPSVTYTATGLVSGDDTSVFTTQPTCVTTGYNSTAAPGTTFITSCSGAAAANYTFAYATGTLTMVKADQATLTVTSTAGTFGTPLTLTTSGGSGTGAVTWAASNGSASGCQVTGSSLASTSAGTCLVTATQADDTNYNQVVSAQTTVTLAPATPTAAAWADDTRAYGSAAFTPTPPQVDGVGAATNIPGTWAYSSSNSAVATVSGTQITIAGVGTTIITGTFTPTDSANYTTTTATMTLTGIPDAPTGVSVSASAVRQVTVSWSAPTYAPIARYEVVQSTDNVAFTSVTQGTCAGGVATLSCTVDTLAAGTTYYFAVVAVANTGGVDYSSAQSTSSSGIAPYGDATQLVITTAPVAGASGSVLTTQPVVKVYDANGQRVLNSTAMVTVASSGGSLTGTMQINATGGIVAYTDLAYAGLVNVDDTLTFTSPTLTSADDTIRPTGPGAAATIAVNAGQGQTAVAGSAVAIDPSVFVTDDMGNPVSGVPVVFQIQASAVGELLSAPATQSGSIPTKSDVFNAFKLTAPTDACLTEATSVMDTSAATGYAVRVYADSAGSPGALLGSLSQANSGSSTVSYAGSVSLSAGTTYWIAVQGSSTTAVANVYITTGAQTSTFTWAGTNNRVVTTDYGSTWSPIASAMYVPDLDLDGVTGFTCGAVTQAGSLAAPGSPATINTDASGIATSPAWTLATTAGTNTLTATSAGLTGSPVTFTATGVAGTAASLELSRAAAGAASGAAFTTQPRVSLLDANGNVLVADDTTRVSVSISPSATLIGDDSVTVVDGVATFTNLGVSGTAGSYTLTYSGGGLTVSQSLTLTVGAAAALSVTTAASGATYGNAWTSQPVVAIVDSGGNTLVDDSTSQVSIAVSVGGTLAGTTTRTVSGGVATFSGLSLTGTPSTYTLTYSSGVLPDVTASLVLGQSAQTITFGALPNKVYGDDSFTVSASASSFLPVSFTSQTAGVCTVSGSTVTIVGAGTCTIRAWQSGDANYLAAPDVDQSFTVAKGNQAALTITSTSGVYGSGLTLTVTGGTTAGSVTYPVVTDGTATGCSVTAGVLTVANAGTCLVTATMVGDSDYEPVSSAATTITFAKFTPSTGTWNPATAAFGSAPLSLTPPSVTGVGGASLSSAGAWTYVSSNPTVATVMGLSIDPGIVGTATITGTFTPDDSVNYATVTATTTVSVTKANQAALTITSPSSFVYGGSLLLVSAGGSGSGALTWTATNGTATGCAITGTTLTATSTGTCLVDLAKAGDANHNPVSASQATVTVTKASQTISFMTTPPLVPRPFGSYAVQAVASSGLPVTLAITTGSPTVCQLSVGTVTFNAAGTCTITASQPGDGNFNAAVSVTQTIVVGSLNQSITFAQPADHNFGEPDFTLTATASSGLRVSFQRDNAQTTNNACAVDDTGVVTVQAVGACAITASQPGNAQYAAASPVTRVFQIVPVPASAPFITSVSVQNAGATLTFTPPGFLGGSAVTAYQVNAIPDGGGSTVSFSGCAASGSPLECSLTGLANGTGYRFTVQAITAAGIGAASPMVPAAGDNPITSAVRPNAVDNLIAVRGNTTLRAEWAPLTNAQLGGGSFTEYRVSIEAAAGGGVFATATLGAQSDDSHTFTGLTNGVPYVIEVVAITTANATPLTGNTAIVSEVPARTPDPVSGTYAATSGTTGVVSWPAPVSDGGSPVTAYNVTMTGAGGPFTCSATPPAQSCAVSGLTRGAAYAIEVEVVNAVGASTDPPVDVTQPNVPASPVITGATAVTVDDSIGFEVTWTAPADNGAPITGYVVTATKRSAMASASARVASALIVRAAVADDTQFVCTSSTTACVMFAPGSIRDYAFVVAADNLAGMSPESAPFVVPDPTPPGPGPIGGRPGPPVAVAAMAGDRSAVVSWQPPVDSGAYPVTNYEVVASPGGATCLVRVPTLSCTISGLANGTAYTFAVRALNGAGWGTWSTPSKAVTPGPDPVPPGPVRDLAAIKVTAQGTVTLTWRAPAFDGGSPVTSYRVRYRQVGTAGYIRVKPNATESRVRITGLTPGARYWVRVAARNEVGYGPGTRIDQRILIPRR